MRKESDNEKAVQGKERNNGREERITAGKGKMNKKRKEERERGENERTVSDEKLLV